jgi:hypothetical protein
MTESIPEVIHIDYSIFSTFQTCREKARLSYVESWRPMIAAAPLDFGSAWHRGIEALYVTRSIDRAKRAFTDELKERGSALPLNMESDEKRSIERGLYLLEAYEARWKESEPFKILMTPEGKPYVEVGFSVYICSWNGVPVMYSGVIDRIMQSTITGMVANFETKTTSSGLTQFSRQVKPNHQVTGYHLASASLGLNINETVWDMTFVSDRKPDARKGGWMTYGIDFEKDFGRVATRRSEADIAAFLQDLTQIALEYCEWRYGDLGRRLPIASQHWPRNAPTACSMYGRCQFSDVCASNLNMDLLRSTFKVEVWEPWNKRKEKIIA